MSRAPPGLTASNFLFLNDFWGGGPQVSFEKYLSEFALHPEQNNNEDERDYICPDNGKRVDPDAIQCPQEDSCSK
jgi:hypothetical protein